MKPPGGRRRWSSPRGAPDVACNGGIGGKGTPSWRSVTASGECRKAWIYRVVFLVYVPVNDGFLVVVIDYFCGFLVDWYVISAPLKILAHPHITLMNMFHEHFSYVSTIQNIAHPHISLINMFHKHFSYVCTFQNIFTSISSIMEAGSLTQCSPFVINVPSHA